MLIDKVIVFDSFKQKAFLTVNISADGIVKSNHETVTISEGRRMIVFGNHLFTKEDHSAYSHFKDTLTQKEFEEKKDLFGNECRQDNRRVNRVQPEYRISPLRMPFPSLQTDAFQ